jgi:hypothetical protein
MGRGSRRPRARRSWSAEQPARASGGAPRRWTGTPREPFRLPSPPARLALRGSRGYHRPAGWSSPVARWAHNPEVTGSNPVPATRNTQVRGVPSSGAPLPFSETCERTANAELHHHPYELAPTGQELTGWLDELDAILEYLEGICKTCATAVTAGGGRNDGNRAAPLSFDDTEPRTTRQTSPYPLMRSSRHGLALRLQLRHTVEAAECPDVSRPPRRFADG